MTSICRDPRPDVSSKIKRVGPFLLGPNLGNNTPVQCLQQYLARRELTRDYYTVKVLSLPEHDDTEPEPLQEQQGKMLLYTEHKLLNRLKGQNGIIQHKGFFKEVKEEQVEVDGKIESRKVTKLCLVLDAAATPHHFDTLQNPLINLQTYVLRKKKIPEREAISIFINIVQIVERLHRDNIVHRDLKLGNLTFNLETKEVILTNFGLGKELENEGQLLKDQRGSPAYISPEVIAGKPYLGKPSDMWALGVTLYTLLFGTFPFYEKDATELFKKIKAAEYKIPGDAVIGSTSVNIIQNLLILDPAKRLTASQLLQCLNKYVNLRYSNPHPKAPEDYQVVPQFPQKRSHEDCASELSPDVPRSAEEPSIKRSKVEEHEPNLFDLEEILVANASPLDKDELDSAEVEEKSSDVGQCIGIRELPHKRLSLHFGSTSGLRSIKISKVKEEARILTQGDLEKLYAIYVANKSKSGGGISSAGVDNSAQAQPIQSLPQHSTVEESSFNVTESEDELTGRLDENPTSPGTVSDSLIAAAPPSSIRETVPKRLRLTLHQLPPQNNSQTPETVPSCPVN